MKENNFKMFLRNNNNKNLSFKTLKNFNIKNDDFNNIFNILNTTYSKKNKNNKKYFFPKIKKLNNIDYNNNLHQSHSVKYFLSKRRFLIQNFNKTNEKLFHKNFIKKKILNNNNNNNDSLNENDYSSKIKTIFIDDKINFIKTHLQSFNKNNNKNNNNNFIINNKGNFNLKNLHFDSKKFFHTKIIDNKDGSICFVYDKNYNENDYKLKNDMKKFKEKNKSIDNFIKKYEIKEKNNIKKRSLSKEEIKKINKSVFEDKNIFKKLLKIIKN